MEGETPEIQDLHDIMERIKDNQFISFCDISGIKRFEELLGITPSITDDLDARIFRVLTVWMDLIPYTYRVLLERLTSLVGEMHFSVIPDFNNYHIEIHLFDVTSSQISSVDELLGSLLPANLTRFTTTSIIKNIDSNIYLGGYIVEMNHFNIDGDVDVDIIPFVINCNLNSGGYVIQNYGVTFSDTSDNVNFTIDSNVKTANFTTCNILI